MVKDFFGVWQIHSSARYWNALEVVHEKHRHRLPTFQILTRFRLSLGDWCHVSVNFCNRFPFRQVLHVFCLLASVAVSFWLTYIETSFYVLSIYYSRKKYRISGTNRLALGCYRICMAFHQLSYQHFATASCAFENAESAKKGSLLCLVNKVDPSCRDQKDVVVDIVNKLCAPSFEILPRA